MKLVCLNIWGGKQLDLLLQFVSAQAADTDIFCFQEMIDGPEGFSEVAGGFHVDVYRRLRAILPGFNVVYTLVEERMKYFGGENFTTLPTSFGQATFIRKELTIKDNGLVWLTREFGEQEKSSTIRRRMLQHVTIERPDGRLITVNNIHGLLDDQHKGDSPARDEQYSRVTEFLKTVPHAKILCGDFNTRPEVKSLELMEQETGMLNLVRSQGITVTRSPLYPDREKYRDYSGDYLLVSPQIDVKSFAVPMLEVSDHLPLILEFD